eukprot:6201896-Pleurochrysis_carterae.AAC.4
MQTGVAGRCQCKQVWVQADVRAGRCASVQTRAWGKGKPHKAFKLTYGLARVTACKLVLLGTGANHSTTEYRHCFESRSSKKPRGRERRPAKQDREAHEDGQPMDCGNNGVVFVHAQNLGCRLGERARLRCRKGNRGKNRSKKYTRCKAKKMGKQYSS